MNSGEGDAGADGAPMKTKLQPRQDGEEPSQPKRMNSGEGGAGADGATINAIKSDDIYRCLVQHSADGFVLSDPDGTITSCNPAFARLVGRTEKEIIGQALATVIDLESSGDSSTKEKDGPRPASTISGATNGTKGEEDHTAPRPTVIINRAGVDFTMPTSHIAVRNDNGEIHGHVTVVYIVQANTVQQAQTEFVSTVSHELRTPLTSIKGFADTILRAGDRLDAGQQRRYVGIIKDQADRLTRLVEDLLAVSRLESKRMQLTIRALDLNEAVHRVVRNLADKAGNHRIVVNIAAGLPPVWADADRLEQILTNLIDNAIKYSPAKTVVTVSARDTVEGNQEMVEFSVSDQGVGIPQEHLPEIFTKFSRLDNPLVRQTEGTGLGLYITRSLVLALGGQIKVTSSAGGTTFTVQLPAASLEEQAARGRDLT
jgi:two-component system phosphate regulon sensor histidine kinase PhoR